jgi:alpha-L-rhamnosidase
VPVFLSVPSLAGFAGFATCTADLNNFNGGQNRYGNQLAFFARLEVELVDERMLDFSTDEDWEVGRGCIRQSDPKAGEVIDLRLPRDSWEEGLQGVEPVSLIAGQPCGSLIAEETDRLTAVGRLQAQRVWKSPAKHQLIDFGQNFCGVVRGRVQGAPDAKVTITYTELLDKEGEINLGYLKPIGKDQPQRDEIVLSGETEWVEPMFTIRGFRYVEIRALPSSQLLERSDIEGIILSSQLHKVSQFSCSDKRIEQLYQNSWWSMQSNFLSTPTDCPTRERAGWRGDIQIFSPTAMLFADVQAYLHRYLRNVAAEQYEDGRIPPYIPSGDSEFVGRSIVCKITSSSAGWGDASTFIP